MAEQVEENMKSSSHRNKRGAMMGFIIAGAIVFIIVAIGLIQLSMLIGGSRELSNAVDSGTLNTARLATTITVDTTPGNESEYNDVAENGKSYSLKSINRMWGKCLLCLMNEKAMQDEGYSTGTSKSHADMLYSAAESISDRLSDKLNDESNLFKFFDDMASRESMRMLGKSAGVTHDAGGWETSLMDRTVESNIAVYSNQFPSGFDLGSTNTTHASDNKDYFRGYDPIKVLGHNVGFVPYKLNAQPHLVSNKTFDENLNKSKPLNGWPKPVPNAFSCQGKTVSQKEGMQKARAFALVNPQKTYDLRIAHGFIKIKLDKNTCHWYLNGVPFPDQEYGYFPPEEKSAGPMWAGVGTLTGQGMVGLEFEPPTLWNCLMSYWGGDYSKLKEVLLQRCHEMNHSFTQNDLESMLGLATSPSVMAGIKDFYIYPDDNGNIHCSPSTSDPFPPPWVLTGGDPDGSEKEICSGDSWMLPNWCIPILEGPGPKPVPPISHMSDSVNWTPGTGFNGCLGKVRVTHDTYFFVEGVCTLF